MKKRIILLAINYQNNDNFLCPGGIDFDNPKEWVQIVRDDGTIGVQEGDIDSARPLDMIEFDGHPVSNSKQQGKWVIDNKSCRRLFQISREMLVWACNEYGYHGFWGCNEPFLRAGEFEKLDEPSVSILMVDHARIYKNSFQKNKIDFNMGSSSCKVKNIALKDSEFTQKLDAGEVFFKNAIIVVSIPESAELLHFSSGEKRAYKFVIKVFGLDEFVA